MNRNGNSLQGLALRHVALALFGVVATVCSEDPAVAAPTPEEGPALSTHLYALESESVRLERFDGSGGAIESMGEDLLVVTPKGRFALVFPDGTAEYLDGNVPMNAVSLGQHDDYDNHFDPRFFRVADILLKELGEGSYELFATHHYFTGECIRFRLSSTTIRQTEESVTVMPDWRAIFDAEPCLPLKWFAGHGAGGKMLTDGADHLLVNIGTHQADLWLARPTSESRLAFGQTPSYRHRNRRDGDAGYRFPQLTRAGAGCGRQPLGVGSRAARRRRVESGGAGRQLWLAPGLLRSRL